MKIAIVHLGDTHGRVDPRSADQLTALMAAWRVGADLHAKGQLAAWLWPGDLFHTVSDAGTRNALFDHAIAMAELAPVVIVRGNHDLPGELDAFAKLQARWPIRVSLAPELLKLQTPIVDPRNGVHAADDPLHVSPGGSCGGLQGLQLACHTLPYPNKGALVSAGTPIDAIPAAARAALDGFIIAAAAELQAAGDFTIKAFAFHANVEGAVSSTGQPQIGNDISIDVHTLERLPVDCYVAGNHIHKHQQIGRAVFAGSMVRMDFGELEPKGIVVAWYDCHLTTGVTLTGWEFRELQVPAMYHVEGNLTPQGFDYRIRQSDGGLVSPGTGELMRLTDVGRAALAAGTIVSPTSFKGADVRVRYTYKRADVAALNVAHIHAEFAEARTLKIEAVPIDEREIRAPEVVAAPTLVAKLEHYAGRQGLEWTESLQAMAADLESRTCDEWRNDALSRIAEIGKDVVPEGV